MGSLSNLYISQSYQSLIHFGNDTSASATLVEIQDGVGTGLGIYLNTTGSISASNTITTNNLVVNNSTELTGVFDLDTYFTASTPAYINSTQPFFTDTVFVTGSYPLGGYPPSIADVEVGWIGNGINVTNGIVTAVSQSVGGYYITMAGQFPQISQSYRFTGRISPTAKITGSLEISENLIVSGTFDIEGKVVVNDNVRINGNLEVSGSQRNTGSLFVSNEISSSTINGIGNVSAYSSSVWAEFTNIENYTSSLRAAFTASGVNTIFTNDITASNIEVRNNLNVVGTITANKIVTLIESASVIYSSGSNILGDEITDTQTLIGSVIISGSGALTGSLGISNNLSVGGNISSSTISGIGNVTSYSQSVDARLDFLEGPFSTSVDSRLDALEDFSSSTFNTFSQSVDARLDVVEATASLYIPFSTSVDSRLDFLEGPFSTSVDARLNVVEATASLYIPFSTSVDSRLDFLEGPFSTSVDSRLDVVEATASLYIPFSTSVDSRLDALEAFTGSQGLVSTSSFNEYTASTNIRLNNLETTSASVNISIAALNVSSASQQISIDTLNTFTQSANIRLNSLEAATSSYANSASVALSISSLSSSIQVTDNSQTQRINTISSFTGSYATTGSNAFVGNQTITGSLILSSSAAIELGVVGNSIFSGSVRGQVFPITISSNTASMDCNLGNFFTLTLPAGTTRLEATNIQPGETLSLRILNSTSASAVSSSTSVKFPTGFSYVPTAVSSSTDIITFLSFDTASIFAVAANYFA